jgi:dihydroxy-acid dehydratase
MIDEEELKGMECAACPSAGSCGGQFTANTMACVSEAIGLALPGSAGAPAPYESRDAWCEASGRAVMECLEKGIRPRDIVTRKSLENAARSSRRRAGRPTRVCTCRPSPTRRDRLRLDDVTEIFKSTPYIADLKPGGRYVAKDMYEIGGVRC